MSILKKLILACPLVILVWNIAKESTEAKKLKEQALRDMAEIDAEEQKREAERRNIPRPEKTEDVTVEEREGTLITMDNKEYHIRVIGLYCKGKLVNEYETRTEAEAARLQYLYDNGVADKEDFAL